MQTFELLKTVSEQFHSLKNKEVQFNWNDGLARDMLFDNGYYDSFSFSLKTVDTSNDIMNYDKFIFEYTRMSYSKTGVVWHKECCLQLYIGSTWYSNHIDIHRNYVCLNNIPSTNIILSTSDSDFARITVSESELTEEWIFQLSTLHNIPSFEEVMLLNGIRKNLMEYNFPISFRYDYAPKYSLELLKHVQSFFDSYQDS